MRKAAQGTLAAPMLALLPSLAEALGPKKNASATDTSSEQMKPSAKPTVSLNVKDYGAILKRCFQVDTERRAFNPFHYEGGISCRAN